MAQRLLITQCMQNDFVKPLGKYDRLPNRLHVGYEEAKRLLGEKPSEGPVARVMAWASAQASETLTLLHIRDWHDPDDPAQQNHLDRFGSHCLAGSDGARFVFEPWAQPSGPGPRTEIVDSLTLNDFHGTLLAELFASLNHAPLRIGLMGVWTEAKITFLAYELRTRYPAVEVAVCSALTAGSSRAHHFLALEQLEKIVGVRIFPSVGEFLAFLGGEAAEQPLIGYTDRHPRLELAGEGAIADEDTRLLRYLFRDCRTVTCKPLAGGFSGNLVLATSSTDLEGHEQVPHVVKVGPREPIGTERSAFERIESVLGNNAPRITDFADMGERGAIKYRYASMGRGAATTFQKLYARGGALTEVKRVLEEVFEERLGRLYAAGTREKCDLLEYYCFKPDWAPGVRRKVEGVLGGPATSATLAFPGGVSFPNPCRFYEETLVVAGDRRPDYAYFACVHGDLNGANIIVDAKENVWLIDFFHTHRGHVLKDLLKLENDLLYIFTPLEDDAAFVEALDLTNTLLAVEDLAQPLPELSFSAPQLERAYETVRFLRAFYPKLIREDGDPFQALIGQLRYAVHTLSFDESSGRQKKWALYAAGHCAARIAARCVERLPEPA